MPGFHICLEFLMQEANTVVWFGLFSFLNYPPLHSSNLETFLLHILLFYIFSCIYYVYSSYFELLF